MVVHNATPLLALDAVVIDTETTSLDPGTARVVEIAAIRVAGGRIDSERSLRRLVRPDISIPPAATAIHHLDDAKVADAPRFEAIWPELAEYIAGSVVIGHAVGFDLAVLKRECERAKLAFQRPSTLDTRLLAQLCEPNLADFSLDSLAAWLAIAPTDRHSALGDAVTTARIFAALVPKLREGGIRTVGEAMQACRALTTVLDEQHRAGWVEAPARLESERSLARIDSYPYRHRVRDAMSAPAKFVTSGTSLVKALTQLIDERISSVFVRPPREITGAPQALDTGIVTERDVMRAISKNGGDALVRPVSQLMSKPLAVVAADDFVYRAIGRMSRLGIRHLGVVDETGRVIGALSARDLLKLRASEAVSLGDEIDQARDIHALGAAWAKLPQVAAALLAEGVNGRGVAAVISREIGALTRKAVVIAEQRVRAGGQSAPPCPYAVAVLGSAGRGESLLAMDQDNALIFAEGEPGGSQDSWFEKLGVHIADILHEVGMPYCKGGVMANNPQWRGSLATWRKRIGDWMLASKPEHLLSTDIFFDLCPVYGDGALCAVLWQEAFDLAHQQLAFAKLLAETAGDIEAGLGLFGRFKTKEGRIDLKKAGLFGTVSVARVLAIRHHVVERSTPARLAGVKALGIGAAYDLDALDEAQGTFLDLVLAQQIDDIDHGKPPSNAVEIKRLSARDRTRLHAALEAVRNLDDLTRDLLFEG